MSAPTNLLAFRQASPASVPTPDILLGPSPAIARVWSQIRRVAPYFRTALITGERGTGAASVAQALHALSPLAARPFTVLSPQDAEARLAGSTLPRLTGDTLYFPAVEHLTPAAQYGLLRLLGMRRGNHVSVVASATTASTDGLRPFVSAGAFSSALALQLSGLHITLPALRDRREDIPALATHFLQTEAHALGITYPPTAVSFMDALTAHSWPGNLDQLRAVLRRLLELYPDTAPETAQLLRLLESSAPESPPAPESVRLLKLEQVVQEHIRAVLLRCNGNKLRAAEVLGISRSTLYRMLDAQAAALPIAV